MTRKQARIESKKLAHIICNRVGGSSQAEIEEDIESAILQTDREARVEQIEKDIRLTENSACNARAKHTCCLENGLNARIIIADTIRSQSTEIDLRGKDKQ